MPLKKCRAARECFAVSFGRLCASPIDTLGPLTFNLGTIQGGSKINIVPDLCEAEVDIRTLPGQDLSPLLDSLAARFPGVEFERTNFRSAQDRPHPSR